MRSDALRGAWLGGTVPATLGTPRRYKLWQALGGPAGAAPFAFARSVAAPTVLRKLGMAVDDLDHAADLVTRNPC